MNLDRTAFVSIHPWKTDRNSSDLDWLLSWVLVALSFSLPLEGGFQLLTGASRSLGFYFAAGAIVLAFLRFFPVFTRALQVPGFVPIIIAYAWMGLLYFANPIGNLSTHILIIQLLLFTVLYLYWADDSMMRERYLWAYWAGWVVLVLWSIYQLISQDAVLDVNRFGETRAIGILGYTANQHAHQIGLGVVVSWMMIFQTKRTWLRAVIAIAIALSLVPLLATSSKGGTLAAYLTLALWGGVQMFVFRKVRHLVAQTIVGVSIIIVGVSLVQGNTLFEQLLSSYINRLNQMIMEENYSSRDVLTTVGIEVALEHPFGVGLNNSQYFMAQKFGVVIDAHNYYVRTFAEGGFPGLILMMGGLAIILRNGWHHYLKGGSAAYFWGFFYLLVVAAVGRSFHYEVMWMFLAMNAVTPSLPESPPKSVSAVQRKKDDRSHASPRHRTVLPKQSTE